MDQFISFAIVSLITAGFLWPSEGAIDGDGLTYASMWMLLGAIELARQSFQRPGIGTGKRRWYQSLVAAGFTLLVIAHWISTWHVFNIEGDRRAALNLSFQWTAAAAACWLVTTRAVCQVHRQRLTATLVGIGCGLALVGAWQHHYFYPAQAEWYQQQTGLLHSASRSDQTPVQQARTRIQLHQMQLPGDDASRQLFEQRLLGSSEPFGTFALANTLGGFLAVICILLAGSITGLLRHHKARFTVQKLVLLAVLAAIAYCLILTKSRTAWLGTTLAIAALFLAGRSRTTLRQYAIRAEMAVGAAVIIAAGSLALGVIDREVITESPRSLQFRLLYWEGTAGVIGDNPITGTGPGNFRQAYLKHKRPESSEEILDPHNVVLDAWATTGLTGLAGIVAIICACGICLITAKTDSGSLTGEGPGSVQSEHRRMYIMAACAGIGIHHVARWWQGAPWTESETVFLLVPAMCVAMQFVSRIVWRCDSIVVAAAACGLLAHLMGAGGLQIAVVPFLLAILCGILVSSPRSQQDSEAGRMMSTIGLLPAVMLFVVFGLTMAYGVDPVRKSQRMSAEAAYLEGLGKTTAAIGAYRAAAAADPLSPKPRQQELRLLTYDLLRQLRRSESTGSSDPASESLEDQIENALAACGDLAMRDRHSIVPHLYLSRIHFELRDTIYVENGLRTAIAEMENALAGYPSNSFLWFETADLHVANGDGESARYAAMRALEIDRINHEWGHPGQVSTETGDHQNGAHCQHQQRSNIDR